jgi:hypothetical protein
MLAHSLVIGLLLLFPWSLVGIIVLGSVKSGAMRLLGQLWSDAADPETESLDTRRVS